MNSGAIEQSLNSIQMCMFNFCLIYHGCLISFNLYMCTCIICLSHIIRCFSSIYTYRLLTIIMQDSHSSSDSMQYLSHVWFFSLTSSKFYWWSMAGDNNHGRFSFSTIYNYIKDGIYPDGFSKSDKGSLRKWAKFCFHKGSRFVL